MMCVSLIRIIFSRLIRRTPMTESMQALLRTIEILPEMEVDWKSNSNSSDCHAVNLLPTDDQLDLLVDNLCDTFPSLKVKLDNDLNNNTSSDSSGSESSSELAQDTSTSFTESTIPPAAAHSNVLMESMVVSSEKKNVQIVPEKRGISYPNLSTSMIRCVRHLERLSETRKSLEVHVRVQPHILSSMTRLPESPTRVDRLIFEVDQERSRVLSLIAALEDTIKAFSAISTKDDLRCMLERFRQTIVNVMKERLCEVDALRSGAYSDMGNRATQLAQLIDEVIMLMREANTALWCLKQQVLTVKSRKYCLKASAPQSMITSIPASAPANGAAIVVSQSSPNFEQQVRRSPKVSGQPKMNGTHGGNEGRSQKKFRGGQRTSTVVTGASRTDVFSPTSQSSTLSSKSKKSSAMQLLAQQQRAEIFQRYASALTSTHKDSTVM